MLKDYTIEYFRGLDQSQNENRLDPGMTADGANMITDMGNLTVGYGFRHTFNPESFPNSRVPEEVNGNPVGDILRMYYWHTLSADKFIVCAGNYIFAWDGSKWVVIMDYGIAGLLNDVRITTEKDVLFDKTAYMVAASFGTYTFTYDGFNWKLFGNTVNPLTYGIVVKDENLVSGDTITVKWSEINITSRKWDFVECKIKNDDYLLISNGQTQIVKWNGKAEANAAELFGTGDYVYNGAITAMTYNAEKATLTTYSETIASLATSATSATKAVYALVGGVGAITLTMPTGWAYSAGTAVKFQVPEEITGATTIQIKISSNTYTLASLPVWDAGETVIATLDSTTAASESNGSTITRTGLFTLVMPNGWTYTEGCKIAFDIPADMNTLNKCRIRTDNQLYELTFIPIWAAGDTVVVSLYGSAAVVETKITAMAEGSRAVSSNVLTVTIDNASVPADWVYSDDCWVSFSPTAATANTITGVKLVINGTTYTLNNVPAWTANCLAIVRLNTTYGCYGTMASEATSESYSVADYVGKYTLTMPVGWAYAYGTYVSFIPSTVHQTISKLSVEIDGTEYVFGAVPVWTVGERVYLKLGKSSKAEPAESDVKYGIESIITTPAIPTEWEERCRNVGMYVDYITSNVDKIEQIADPLDPDVNISTKVTFKEVISRKDKPVVGDIVLVRGGISDIPVTYMDLYYNRLMCAGDPEHPSRLYWSQPPGDVRTIEDWSMDDASELSSGGHTEVGNTSSEPIVAIVALSNQLLIFKEASVWRLIGDRPSNYAITRVNKDMEMTTNSSIIANGDVPFWITRAGMYYHDGQTAHLSPTARQIQGLLETVNLENCKSCENRDRLYFSCRVGAGPEDDTLIVYDQKERVHLIRNGFKLTDVCSYNGIIYMINSDRFIYQWDKECHTYAGYENGEVVENPIHAYWNTPFTDLQARSVTKHVKWLYLRGKGDKALIDIKAGPYVQHETYAMPAKQGDIIRIPLRYEGRAIGLRLQNVAGGWFDVEGGLTLRYEAKEDGT